MIVGHCTECDEGGVPDGDADASTEGLVTELPQEGARGDELFRVLLDHDLEY